MAEKKSPYLFPDPLAPDSEKRSKEYGLTVAHAIANDWFNGLDITQDCTYYNRKEWIRKMRLESRGKGDIGYDRDIISRDEMQLDFMNMDWRDLNTLGKFVNIVVNGNNEDLFQVDVSAIDQLTNKIRQEYREQLEADMHSFKMLQNARRILGIDLTPKGFVPDDEEELDLHMELDYKPIPEVIEELLIKYVKKINNWHNIKQKVNYDFVESGLGAVRCYTDKIDGIKLKYVNIENLVHSYVTMNDFSDAHYFGEVESITLAELQRTSDLSEKDIRIIAEKYAGVQSEHQKGLMWGYNYENGDFNRVLGFNVNICHFTFKTAKTIVYKKNKTKHGTLKMTEKDETFEQKRSDFERVDNTYETWYEGSHIIGTDYIYNYRESENIVEDEMQRASSNFIVRATDLYENTLHSFVEDCLPIKSQMQRVHLKIQQLVAELRPDPIELDLDMLAELDSGEQGKEWDWRQALALFNAKGIYFSTRANLGEDGMKDRPAVRHAPQAQSSQLPALLNAWAHYYNLLREITGINPFRDGTQPSDALVGVQQMAVMASNTATEYIVKASMDLTKTVSERISSRLSDIYKHSNLKEKYTNAIGRKKIEYREYLKDRHLHDFGFTLSIIPTEAELMEFRQSLEIALKEQSIDVEVKIQAEAIAQQNIKQALMYMSYKRRKALKKRRDEELENIQVQAQANARSAQQAEQLKMQSEQLKAQLEIEKEQAKSLIRVKERQAMIQVETPNQEKEWTFELYKEQLKAQTSLQNERFKEAQKTFRQDRNNSQASRMIDQRNNDSAPIDFQNELSLN